MSEQERSPIAVVDDNFEHLDLVIETLTRAGYRCLGFTSARNAFTQIIQSPVDLIIADIFMPEMDGFELLRLLRRMQPDVPVITVSGEGHMTRGFYLDCAMHFGAVATLRKPFDPDALTTIVAQHLGYGSSKRVSRIPRLTEQPPTTFKETQNAKA